MKETRSALRKRLRDDRVLNHAGLDQLREKLKRTDLSDSERTETEKKVDQLQKQVQQDSMCNMKMVDGKLVPIDNGQKPDGGEA